VLELADEMKLLKLGTISLDGSKLQANAISSRGESKRRTGIH
jgi:hypothetical protein